MCNGDSLIGEILANPRLFIKSTEPVRDTVGDYLAAVGAGVVTFWPRRANEAIICDDLSALIKYPMPHDSVATPLYHITDVSNLPGILAAGGLRSDVGMAAAAHEVIGYDHIKQRRMTELTVPCRGGRFVGEFVPFYFCPRSPMLYTINLGNTGRPAGCQSSIVHLVSTIGAAVETGSDWAFSNGNAGSRYADFFADLHALATLDWEIIGSNDWGGDNRRNKKASEFLVADFFPWKAINTIGCHNHQTAGHVSELLEGLLDSPNVAVKSDWYY